jgi:hypothetical protein
MNEQDSILKKLDKYTSTIHKAIIGVAIFEAILVIFIGIASNNLNTNNIDLNKYSLYSLVFFGIAYLFILFFKTLYSKTYPASIVNELKSEKNLEILTKDYERQNTINSFLVTTIERLNGQTCALNYGDETDLCDKGIKDGIYNLIEPVIDNIYFVLDTINTNFTIGVFLESYASSTQDEVWESGIITISDKLNKEFLLEKNLLQQANVRDEKFHIQTAIRSSYNNHSFGKTDYTVNNIDYSIICSPMPFACNENELNGILFIIAEKLGNLPNETETNLKIFNRVIANWIYRYNECMTTKLQGRMAQQNHNSD